MLYYFKRRVNIVDLWLDSIAYLTIIHDKLAKYAEKELF